MNVESLYEQSLLIRSRLGDEAAFAELYQIHAPAILKFTERMMQSSSAQIDDVLQEIWLAAFKNLPRLESAAHIKPWLFRIARDRIFQEYRRAKRIPAATSSDDLPETCEPESPIDLEELQKHLSALTPEHREALLLHYLEELSYAEISQIARVSIGTIRSRIFYAKQIMRSQYERNYE